MFNYIIIGKYKVQSPVFDYIITCNKGYFVTHLHHIGKKLLNTLQLFNYSLDTQKSLFTQNSLYRVHRPVLSENSSNDTSGIIGNETQVWCRFVVVGVIGNIVEVILES